jgi:hypothetical protein
MSGDPTLQTPSVHAEGATSFADLPAVGDFTRLTLWMAGALSGLATPTHSAQRKYFRSLARRLGWPVGKALLHPRPGIPSAMPLLNDALFGTSRAAIASVFGPPHCGRRGSDIVQNDAVWDAGVWFYPLTNPGASAMSIAFTPDETAGRVLFISYTPMSQE